MDRESTDFQSLLQQFYLESHPEDSLEHALKYLQYVVYRYVKAVLTGQVQHRARGLLVNHMMGTGKTILSQAVADLFANDGYKVIIIGPKALKTNYAENLTKLESLSERPLLAKKNPRYHYLTMKAGNLPDQIFATLGEEHGEQLNLSVAFNNAFVIIDEAHLFFNSVAHGRSVACQIYDALMSTKKCWILPMTGTMIINSTFEIVPAFNLLLGRAYFPEIKEEFDKYYGTSDLLLSNQLKLQDQVTGLITRAQPNAADFPKELRTKVVKLEMEGDQYKDYVKARGDELEEVRRAAGRPKRPSTGRFAPDNGGSSTYRVYTRMISNQDNKWKWLAERMLEHPTRLLLMQFYFIHRGGMEEFVRYLDNYYGGKFKVLNVDATGLVLEGPEGLKGSVFAPSQAGTRAPERDNFIWLAMFHGDVKPEIRDVLVNIYRDPRNKHGAFCQGFMISTTGLVGLDLKNVRDVVWVSPGWQIEDWNQFKFRAIRYKSHVELPPDEHSVQPYILISIGPTGVEVDEDEQKKVIYSMPTTDEELLIKCLTKMKENATCSNILDGVTLECLAGVSDKPEVCRSCMANNQKLLTGKFSRDMLLPSGCHPVPGIEQLQNIPFEELKDKLEEAHIKRIGATDGKHYYDIYYSRNPLRIYTQRNGKLVSMSILHPLYERLSELIGALPE